MPDRTELVYEAADEMELARARAFLSSEGIPFWVQRLTTAGEDPSIVSPGAWISPAMRLHGGAYARVHVPEKLARRAREVLEAMVSGEIVAEDIPASEGETPPGTEDE